MSSYNIKARNKKTGEIVQVACIDDYFAHRVYGYIINSSVFDGKKKENALTWKEFSKQYEEVKKVAKKDLVTTTSKQILQELLYSNFYSEDTLYVPVYELNEWLNRMESQGVMTDRIYDVLRLELANK